MPIDFGGGMIFPSSYGRDQYSAAEERRMEAEQAEDERREDAMYFTHVYAGPAHPMDGWTILWDRVEHIAGSFHQEGKLGDHVLVTGEGRRHWLIRAEDAPRLARAS